MSTIITGSEDFVGVNRITIGKQDLWVRFAEVFKGLVVDKTLVHNQYISKLPRYVSEYLVSKLCRKNDCRKLVDFIRKYYPDPADRDKYLHELMVKGKIKIIDELKVTVDVRKGILKAIIPSLGLKDAGIYDSIVAEHENLLRTGMWGIIELSYKPDNEFKVIVTGFTPFQVSRVDLDWFLEATRKFNPREWVDVVISTIGLNPAAYSWEEKLVLLLRLVPFVEANSNLAEFGPRATGKTFLYRNISYYSRIISGGRVSPAQLFYNIVTKQPGLIAIKDVVVFDEVNRIRFTNEDEVVGKLKDYMESGFFERGPKQAHSDCSLVFIGNVDDEILVDENPVKYLLNVLPGFMKDPALLDRIHGFIPGWRLPKIMVSSIHLSKTIGLVIDFYAEILHQLRRIDYRKMVLDYVELGRSFTIRDEKAIARTISGLIKVIAPHGELDKQLFKEIVDIAIKSRIYVKQLLHLLLPNEYPSPSLEYNVRWG